MNLTLRRKFTSNGTIFSVNSLKKSNIYTKFKLFKKLMKKITIKIVFPVLLMGMSSMVCGQVDKKIVNWYNGKKGMQTEKAYKMVKKLESKEVVVAVIDSGIDVEHEDLKGQIWINTDEIPNNGIDDDNNGYIDDIHGWNFLGNSEGENIDATRLELTRIYTKLKPKYEGVASEDVKSEDKVEYELYLKVKENYDNTRAEYEGILANMDMFANQIIPTVPGTVATALGKEEYTLKDLKKWKPEDAQMKQMRGIAIAMKSGELSLEAIEKQKEQIQSMLDCNYNVDCDDRTLIGDNPDDITDINYGNNNVEGPDALHGTHVGGIIGSVRGNDLGGDGVAANVKLMSLRAVPNGDERDKDIALAIRYAVDNGAMIINGSFGKGYSEHPEFVLEAIKYAESKGVLFVHAAGNDNADVDVTVNFPTSDFPGQKEPFTHYLTIGASTRNTKGELAAVFSNYGQTKVDVFAPGFEIYNTIPDNKYMKLQGTSMASPMVAGAAAFIKGYFPELSMLQVKEILLKSARDYSETDQELPGSEKEVKFGTLSVTGGVVDLKNAVKMAKEMTTK